MFIPFDQLPASSRIWVYQLNKPLENGQLDSLHSDCRNFIENWTAHQQNLHASFSILYHHFLIIAVDENVNDASGCSIDKQNHFIMEIEKKYNISLLDRMKVAYRDSNNQIQIVKLFEFGDMLSDHIVNENTIVFNNLIQNKKEWKESWEIPLKRSWHFQYLEGIRE